MRHTKREAWILARNIFGKGSKEDEATKQAYLKSAQRNADARERRSIIADICGTSYAEAKRDMGL